MLPSFISWLCSKSMRPSPMYSDYFSSKVHWHPGVNTDSNGRLELWDSRSRGDARRSRRTRTDPNRREHKLKSSRAVPWPLSFRDVEQFRPRSMSRPFVEVSVKVTMRSSSLEPTSESVILRSDGPGDDGNFVLAMAIGFGSQLDDQNEVSSRNKCFHRKLFNGECT